MFRHLIWVYNVEAVVQEKVKIAKMSLYHSEPVKKSLSISKALGLNHVEVYLTKFRGNCTSGVILQSSYGFSNIWTYFNLYQ